MWIPAIVAAVLTLAATGLHRAQASTCDQYSCYRITLTTYDGTQTFPGEFAVDQSAKLSKLDVILGDEDASFTPGPVTSSKLGGLQEFIVYFTNHGPGNNDVFQLSNALPPPTPTVDFSFHADDSSWVFEGIDYTGNGDTFDGAASQLSLNSEGWLYNYGAQDATLLQGTYKVERTSGSDTEFPVPEPATWALLGVGLTALSACRRRSANRSQPLASQVRRHA